MQSQYGLKTLPKNDFAILRDCFLEDSGKKKPKIPDKARLRIVSESEIQSEETTHKSIIEPFSCCDASRFWRAGVEVETLLQTVTLPCPKEKAERCRALWDAIEKVQLYEAQSATAKQGSATILKHLGSVRLGQSQAPVADPGIGDIIFNEGESDSST